MKFDLNVLFTVKKSKINKAGLVPIYSRITVKGERAELAINRKIAPKKWDAKLQRASGRSESARALNDYLDSVENQVKRTSIYCLIDKRISLPQSFVICKPENI